MRQAGVWERVAQVLLALLKAICYLGLFLGAQVLVMLPVVMAAAVQQVLEGAPMDQEAVTAVLAEQAMTYTLIADLLTLVVVLVFHLARRKKLSEAMWLRRVDAPALWKGAALAPGLYLLVSAVLLILPESWMDSYNEASSGIASGGLLVTITVVAVAPVVEEIIFRGLIMTRLSQAMPGWLAVLLSAAMFGVCHGHPVWIGYAFVMGAVFGYIDLRAGSIWPSILGHVAFNSIDQLLGLLPDSDAAFFAAIAVLVVVAVAAPILDRAAAKSRPKPQAAPEAPSLPGVYDFDPWDT